MGRTIVVFLCGAVLGAVFLGVPGGLLGQEEDPHAKYGREIPTSKEAQAEMMRRWMAAATPGRHHERLEYFLGRWTTSSKMWMSGEGSGEPVVSSGEATFRWLMDGRWMAQDYSGEMPGMGRMQGFEIMGYDNFRKQYVGFLISNMDTAMTSLSGNIDRTGRIIEMYGKMDEPGLGQVGKTVEFRTRIVDDDHFVFELHDLDVIGGGAKMVEVTYTRAGAPSKDD